MGQAGGRRLPVIIELILQGQQQVSAGLTQIARQYEQLARNVGTATGPLNKTQQAMAGTARQATLLETPMNKINRLTSTISPAVQTVGRSFEQSSRQLSLFDTAANRNLGSIGKFTGAVGQANTSMNQLRTGAVQATSGLQQIGTVTNQAGTAVQNLSGKMGVGKAAMSALREEGRGLAFMSIGLFGAINEAAFMMQNASNSAEKLAEAHAEVTRLEQAGKKGTTEYTRATQELDKAQRANTFTTRIMSQSIFDIVSFGGLAVTQMLGLVQSFRKYRGETAANIAENVKLAASNELVAFSSRQSAIGSLASSGAAISASGRFQALSGILNNTSLGFGNVTKATTGIKGAFQAVGTRLTTLISGALAASGIFSGLAAKMGNTSGMIKQMGTSAAGGTGALTTLTTAGAGVAAAMTAIGIGAGVAAGALAAAVGTMIVFDANVGGARDAAESFVSSMFDFVGASEESKQAAIDNMNAVRDARLEFIETIPVIGDWVKSFAPATDAIHKTKAEQEAAGEEMVAFSEKVNASIADLTGYGKTWQQVGDDIMGYLSDITSAQIKYTDSLTTNLAAARAALAADPTNQGLKDLVATLENLQLSARRSFNEILAEADNTSIGWEQRTQNMIKTASTLSDAFVNLPQPLQTAVTQVTNALDEGIRGTEGWSIEVGDAGKLISDVMNVVSSSAQGTLPPLKELIPTIGALPKPIQDVIQSMAQYVVSTEDVNDNIDLGNALMHLFGQNLVNNADQAGEASESVGEYAKQVAEAAKEVGIYKEVTDANANAIAGEVAAKQQQIRTTEEILEGMRGLNYESEIAIASNATLSHNIVQVGQDFNEVAVGLAGYVDGLKTWRDAQAQAYFDITQTAGAVGYIGDISEASAGKMLDFAGAQTQVAEANATAVESYFALAEGHQRELDVLDLSEQKMGEVALLHRKLSEEQQFGIQVITEHAAATEKDAAAAAELYANNVPLAAIVKMSAVEIKTRAEALENDADGMVLSADAAGKWVDKLLELSPLLQSVGQNLGLMVQEGDRVTPMMEKQAEALGKYDKQLLDAEEAGREFIMTHGGDMQVAIKGTQGDVINSIISFADFSASQEESAEIAEEAAKKTAEAWKASGEEIRTNLDNLSGLMKDASTEVLEDMGKGGKAAGFAWTEEFFNEFMPKELADEKWHDNFDIDDMVSDIRKKIKKGLKDDDISDDVKENLLKPFKESLKNLPDDLDPEEAFGRVMRMYSDSLANSEPILINGITEVGRDIASQINAQLLQPTINELQKGAGAEVITPFLTTFDNFIGDLKAKGQEKELVGWFEPLLEEWRTNPEKAGEIFQQIITELEVLPEGMATAIQEFDAAGDGVPDILQKNLLDPVTQMRIGILETFKGIFNSLAIAFDDPKFAEAANKLGEDIQGIKDAANAADQQITELDTTLKHDPPKPKTFEEWRIVLNGGPDSVTGAAGAAEDSVTDLGTTAETTTGEFIDSFGLVSSGVITATGNVDAFAEAVVGAGGSLRDFFGIATEEAVANKDPAGAFDFFMFGGLLNQQQKQKGGGEEGAAPTAEDPGAMIDPYLEKLQELSDKAKSVIPVIELMWTNHFTNTGAQMVVFGQGPLLQLATAYDLFAAKVPAIIASMELAWTNHLVNTGAQMTVFGQGPLLQLATAYTIFQTQVPMIIAAMELAWTNHLVNTGTQMTTFITGPLTLLAQAYTLFQTNVVPILAAMELAWTNHMVNNGAQIAAFITGPLLALQGAYTTLSTTVVPLLQSIELAWTQHLSNNGEQINGFLSGPVVGYMNVMGALAQSIHESLETSNQNWAAHADHVGNMASAIADHVSQLAGDIQGSMSQIVQSMGEGEQGAEDLKAAIDALEDKTITVTTVFKTVGSPGGSQKAAHGFEGIVRQPTRFVVGEGNQPEFVSVTPLVGRNARGNSEVRGWFDRLKTESSGKKSLERAGEGGLGSSRTLGPDNSGLERPDITRAVVRRKTTLNSFMREVLTYGEEKEYEKLLKKLKKKKWKPSRLNDENEDKLYELEDKIIQARFDQIESIKDAMEQVTRQINLKSDLSSDAELEKWVSTVVPPLSSAPVSMHTSSIQAMSIRGRYDHHREAMKTGRREQLSWISSEYDRQQSLIEEAEETRKKEEEEKDAWLEEHGSKKQKKAVKKRKRKQEEEQRRKLLIPRGARRDLAYGKSAEKYYGDLAKAVDPPVQISLPPDVSESFDISSMTADDDINAKRGMSAIVRNRTNITAGEYGRAERVDITPMGEETKNIAKEVREEIRHFFTGGIGGGAATGDGGGQSGRKQVIYVNLNQPLEVKINDQVIANAVNKALVKVMSGKR